MVSYIWRDAATVGAASSANKIAFELATGTDDNGHIHQSEFKITTALADNEKPNAKLNELQDTQVDSITVTITGSIENQQADGDPNAIVAKVKNFMCDKKTTSSYPKGRFGMALNDFTTFNANPSATLGYMIQDWTWVRDGDTPGKTSFIATLRLNGTILTSGTEENGTYTWWT
tara:strand:+ start:248 stop:769 length:522 start_codon:yes stop_codon:yes gene_type:complete